MELVIILDQKLWESPGNNITEEKKLKYQGTLCYWQFAEIAVIQWHKINGVISFMSVKV